jgi:hypothetical protein
MLLSCGPILEPLIAISISSIISILIFISVIIKTKKSEFYETEFLESSTLKKTGYTILFLVIVISILLFIFYLLFFVIAGIIFGMEKL